MQENIINFKGIKFYNYSFDQLFKKINKGGLLVAPAASALTNISENKIGLFYKTCVQSFFKLFSPIRQYYI